MKTTLTVLVLALCASLHSYAQCFVEMELMEQQSATCVGDDFVFYGFATTDCPMPYTINYLWSVNSADEFGNPVPITEYNVMGTSTTTTSIPPFSYSSSGPEIISACLTVIFYDLNDIAIATGQGCIEDIVYPMPLTVTPVLSTNMCGNLTCLSNVIVTGGSAPYTFQISTGEVITPNFWVCFEEMGIYQVTAIDQNDCVGVGEFVIEPSEIDNSSCFGATELTNGVPELDTLCAIETTTPSCSGYNYYLSGWYVINSENYSHINVGFNSYYYGGIYNQPFAIEVYEEVEGQDCAEASLVYCQSNDTDGACFDLADQIAIQPNTNYYFRPTVQWTSPTPSEILVVLSNEAIPSICGCANPTSCNYDPEALINDGSCGYSGCMDPGACNYMSYATCDDGSCIFGTDISGQIYHDVNGDGLWTNWPVLEPVLGNIGYILIEELNIMVYADANGTFVLPSLDAGVYHITYSDPNGAWILGIPSPLEITLPTCNGLLIPLLPASEAAAQVSGSGWFWNTTLHCTNGFSPGIWVQNTGNVALNGTFTMTFDATLSASAYSGYQPFDSFEDGVATWNIVNQAPGTIVYYMIHIEGPGVDFVGQSFSFDLDLELADNNNVVFYSNNWINNAIVTCAYDPNDKLANPVGYSDQHFILPDDEIEYTIRFQNTGNAPAFDIVIEDQIDIAHLDLSTLEPIIASHSYSTIVEPNGLVQFVFNNIMLPDSFSDEPGSQGYVVYRITPLAGILPESVIENTASIYFDENPPIVTNTTMHTIYDCDMIEPIAAEDQVCSGNDYTVDAFDPYVENYSWIINGEEVGTQSNFIYNSDIPTDASITIQRSNPLCTVEHALLLHNLPQPGTAIVVDGASLTAPAGTFWQWYLNGEVITDATAQSYVPTEDGDYTVQTTNGFGCSSMSESMSFVGVADAALSRILLFPNPMLTESALYLPAGKHSIRVTNVLGQELLNYRGVTNAIRFSNSQLTSGAYMVNVFDEAGNRTTLMLIVR